MSDNRSVPDLFLKVPFLAELRPTVSRVLQDGIQINLPPPGFDPRKATDEELRTHFLPPRPDREKAPRAFEQWEKAMSGPPIWPHLAANEQTIENLFVETRLITQLRLAGTSPVVPQTASANWSGIFARRPTDYSHVTRVQGLWTVPDPKPLDTSARDYASSIWVGLDGHEPASRSLPQIGTGQWVSVDNQGTVQPSIFAWWQWYLRDNPTNGQVAIKAVPISVGDSIYAQVTKIANNVASFFIINLTTNVGLPFWFVRPTLAVLSPTNPLPPRIEGITASWVLERPTRVESTILYTLPNYGTSIFEFCGAGTDDPDPSQELDLKRAKLIRMIDWERAPPSAKVVSTSQRNGPSSIKLHYG